MYALRSIRKILDHLFVIQLLISKPLILGDGSCVILFYFESDPGDSVFPLLINKSKDFLKYIRQNSRNTGTHAGVTCIPAETFLSGSSIFSSTFFQADDRSRYILFL